MRATAGEEAVCYRAAMRRLRASFFSPTASCLALMTLVSLCACTRAKESTAHVSEHPVASAARAATSHSMPDVPFALAEPPLPAREWRDHDLSSIPEGALRALAHQLYDSGAYADAAVAQRWLVQRHVDQMLYNLACYEACAGHVDEAAYWLQRAAREEGIGASWAAKDSDLASLRDDGRWPALLSYLQAMNRYWTSSGLERSNRVVPRKAATASGFPLVIGLHGYGANESFFDESMQPLADATGVAFLSLSGTVAQGPHGFEWSEDVARDLARVDRGVEELTKSVGVDPAHRVVMGFSQGAAVAATLLSQHPEKFAGAIVFSPGSVTGRLRAAPAGAPGRLRGKSVVIRLGAGENAATIASAEAFRDALVGAGARVDYYAYPQQHAHTYPPDFLEKIGQWIAFANGGAPTSSP